jgi:predicted Zn finger-like uncharacterized protein
MILTCPSCGTQYSVKDGAIPPEGRRVRCAACGHSWHQMADSSEDVELPPPPPDAEGDVEVDPMLQEPLSEEVDDGEWSGDPDPAWSPEADDTTLVGQVPVEPAGLGAPLVESAGSIPVPRDQAEGWTFEQVDDDPEEVAKDVPDEEEIAASEEETPRGRRRNWWMAIAIGLFIVALIALGLWFVAPDSLRRSVGLAPASMPLQIAAGSPERQKLASGNELVVVSGRIVNPSSTEQPVPPIFAELHDKSGKLIHSWTIAPPAPTLPPGGSTSFNSAELNVPPSGPDSSVTFSLKS